MESLSLRDRIGHYAINLLITCVITLTVVHFTPSTSSLLLLVLFTLVLPLATIALSILVWFSIRSHLCSRCYSMSDTPGEDAARYNRRLSMVHLFQSRTLSVGYLVLLMGSQLLLTVPLVGTPLWLSVQVSLVYLLVSYATHRKYQPWCPLCYNGGTQTEAAIYPVPSGSQA